MRAISKSLLIHSVEWQHITGTDRFHKAEFEQKTLRFVRLQNIVNGVTIKNAGVSRSDSLTLFIDATHSECVSVNNGEEIAENLTIPCENDKILFSGKEYRVKSVLECYTRKHAAIHHWELSLE